MMPVCLLECLAVGEGVNIGGALDEGKVFDGRKDDVTLLSNGEVRSYEVK